jgi:hypothetical protein
MENGQAVPGRFGWSDAHPAGRAMWLPAAVVSGTGYSKQ